MVQLKLLDLMIRNQNEAVPVDAKARADLIDLMARILVAMFQVEGGKGDERCTVPRSSRSTWLAKPSSTCDSPARNKYGRIRKVSVFSMTWPNGCGLWVGNKWRSSMVTLDAARPWLLLVGKDLSASSVRWH